MKWRTIVTDTAGMTGVAPVCEQQGDTAGMHGQFEGLRVWADEHGVYDCCPWPHIETYGEADARTLAEALNAVAGGEGAEACS